MVAAPDEHPRLLFDASQLATLRQESTGGLRARVLAHLRAVCADRMDPASSRYFDFRERRNDYWRLRAGLFTVLPALNALTIGYAFTGDPAIGDCARDALLEIVDHGLADVASGAWGSRTAGWRHGPGHDKGKLNRAVAWLYDCCHDRFTPAQRRRVIDFAHEFVRLADEWRRADWAQIGNNRGVRGILGTTWLYLALEGEADLPDLDERLDEGARAIEAYLFQAYDAAGASFEGPGYAKSLPYLATTALALRRRGGPDLLTNDRFERIPEYLAYELVPGAGYVNPVNDAHVPSGTAAGSLPLLGTPRGALLPWLVRQLDLHPARIDTWLGERRLGQPINAPLAETLLYFLLWWRDDPPVRTPDQLGYPLARHFRDRGLASLRTGWGPQDWLVSHVCGRQHHAGHRQGDANHVSFYALGESFLVDAGYGDLAAQADTTAPVDRWFGETAAHNCVLVDGASQRGTHPTPGWAEGELLDFQHRDAFATTLGDASSCTGPDHRVRQALRRVALVRGGPAPYLAVVDVNERDGAPFTATHLWHTDPTIRLDLLDAHRFSLTGRRGWCPGQVLWPPDASVTAGSDHGRPQLRLALHAGVTEAVTVFCPRPGEAPPTFACERLAPGAFRIVCAARRRVDPDHQRRHRRPPARPASGAPRRDRLTRSTRRPAPVHRCASGPQTAPARLASQPGYPGLPRAPKVDLLLVSFAGDGG